MQPSNTIPSPAEPSLVIPPGLIERLRAALTSRRLQEGFDLLRAQPGVIDGIGPEQPRSAVLAGYIAQWVDVGFADEDLLRRLLSRFPEDRRAWLAVEEFAHLLMIQATLHLMTEDLDRSLADLNIILSLAPSVEDRELVAMAHFGRARCFRRKGEYGKAYQEAVVAREMTTALGYTQLANVVATLESWILFRQGRIREAAAILERAERALASGDDWVTLGNIQSAFGRLAQREGRYDHAIQRFMASLDYYRRRDPRHPNLARSLANMAHAERVISLQLKKRIDSDAANRRSGTPSSGAQGLRERFEKFRTDALSHLAQAREIFETHLQHHGAGTVCVNSGFLHLDAGDFESSMAFAAEAFQLGSDKADYILMARARLLQCSIENARLDEALEGEEPERHARLAVEWAREAMAYARNTEHTRLLARAHLALGATYCNDFFNDAESARACCDAAAALLKTEGGDPLWEDVRALRGRITHSAGLESTLRAWSQGEVAGKTLQQLTEDFAEFIIPKIWEQEQRKVSRVAARLSVSPKKVRRILARAGLLQRQERAL